MVHLDNSIPNLENNSVDSLNWMRWFRFQKPDSQGDRLCTDKRVNTEFIIGLRHILFAIVLI